MSAPNHTLPADSRKPSHDEARTQAEKFADLARELQCDESEEGFDERLRRMAKVKTLETDTPKSSET